MSPERLLGRPWRILAGVGAGLAALALDRAVAVPFAGAGSPNFGFGGALLLFAFVVWGAAGGWMAAIVSGLGGALLDYASSGVARVVVPSLASIGVPALIWLVAQRTGGLVAVSVALWVAFGPLYDWLVYRYGMGFPAGYVVVHYVKQIFNVGAAALIAEALLAVWPARWRPPGPPRDSIRAVVFSRLALWGLPIALLIGFLYARAVLDGAIRQAMLDQQAAAAGVAGETQRFLDRQAVILEQMADRVALTLDVGRPVDSLLTTFHRDHPAFLNVGLADRSGRLVAASPSRNINGEPLAGMDLSGREYFRAAREAPHTLFSALLIGNLHIESAAPEPVVVVAHAIHDRTGAFNGAILGALDTRSFRPVAREAPPRFDMLILDQHRQLVISSDARVPSGRQLAGTFPAADSGIQALRYYPPTDGTERSRLHLDQRLAALVPVPGTGWTVAAERYTTDLFFAVTPPAVRLAVVLVGFLALITLTAWRASRDIAEPLGAIERSAARLSQAGPTPGDELEAERRNPIAEIRGVAEQVAAMNQAAIARQRVARLQTEEAERLVESMLDHGGVGIVQAGLDGAVIRANRRFFEIVGRSLENLPARSDDLVAPEYRGGLAGQVARLRTGEIPSFVVEVEIERPAGDRVWVRSTSTLIRGADGRPQFVIAALEDITPQRKLQEQLVQAQKMEAIGLLAGGVAHDFNNLLTPIMGYTEMARGEPGLPPRVQTDLEQVQAAAARARDLVRQLLAFGRRQLLQVRPVSPVEAIESVRNLLRPLVMANIEIDVRTAPACGLVRADPGQLQQVLMNLGVNAVDAIGTEGGRLAFTAVPVSLGAEAAADVGLDSGDYVALAVSDTGRGIPPAVLPHVFEPFFTTKAMGRGTGLGLATAYGIVRQHGGAIVAESTVGQGSIFTVYLPRELEPGEKLAAPESPDEIAGGSETVLLAEDDEAVRKLVVTALTRRGYRVLAAESGEQAVAIALGEPEPIPLLVTDVVMGGIHGVELHRRLRERLPGLAVLYITGYAPETIREQLGASGDEPLQKPFTTVQLLRRVRETLDARAR